VERLLRGAFWLVLGRIRFLHPEFLLIDIQHSFSVDKALADALGSVACLFRLVGGMGAGTSEAPLPTIRYLVALNLGAL
jgi:hypothetical protein